MLAYRTNSIKPGMLVHAVHNMGVIAIGGASSALAPMVGEEIVGLLLIGMIVALGIIGLPALISLLRRVPMEDLPAVQILPPPTVEIMASPAV
jgi:hypothetical protein